MQHAKTKKGPPHKAAETRDPDMPHWLPNDDRWQTLPEEIRRAVPRILTPAYNKFVLEAPSELERSMGLTMVHLMWLELCGQVQLAVAAADRTALDAILNDPDAMIDRHLHLIAAKCQTAGLLVRLRALREMSDRRQRDDHNPNQLGHTLALLRSHSPDDAGGTVAGGKVEGA
jgi:hypothetical protein